MVVHFGIALRNGLTMDQLEEFIYHVTAYAGFPAAVTARASARKAFADLGVATPTASESDDDGVTSPATLRPTSLLY